MRRKDRQVSGMGGQCPVHFTASQGVRNKPWLTFSVMGVHHRFDNTVDRPCVPFPVKSDSDGTSIRQFVTVVIVNVHGDEHDAGCTLEEVEWIV